MPSNEHNSNAEAPESNEPNRRLHRLSIKHLMIWVFGVAVAIAAAQHLERSSYEASAAVVGWPPSEFKPMGLTGTVVAAGFGTGISLAVSAIMSGPGFWRDPARIGIAVLGAIGLLNFFVQPLAHRACIGLQNSEPLSVASTKPAGTAGPMFESRLIKK